MATYRCFFKVHGETYHADSDKGIMEFHSAGGGFWVTESMDLALVSNAKYWIPPSQILGIEKFEGLVVKGTLVAEFNELPECWESPQKLQQDSYATGQELAHIGIRAGVINIEVTDGEYSWKRCIPLPKDFQG